MSKTVLWVSIGVIGLGIIAAIVITMTRGRTKTESQSDSAEDLTTTTQSSTASQSPSQVTWQLREDGWTASGTPPACNSPLTPPTDITKATATLYPGQTRGGNYKPHGGFRFDNSKNGDITVTSPITGQVVRGARYLVEGELQYTFDIMAPCGQMVRLGHFLTLSPAFQKIADTFPAASEGDSRTETINPPVAITKGEVMATAVGVTKPAINTFFDWGVYDMTKKNTASQDAAYAASHNVELDQHAVCWLDLLSAEQMAYVKSLPAGDPTSGKTSDYCR